MQDVGGIVAHEVQFTIGAWPNNIPGAGKIYQGSLMRHTVPQDSHSR